MSGERLLDIGDVVLRSGLPVSTLHLWERKGLLTPAGRAGLRRQYDRYVLERIATIVLFKRGGFSLAEIARLLQPGAFADGKDMLVDKLSELRLHRHELDAAIAGLEHALACTEESPLACSRFHAMVGDVLPITDR